MQIKENIKADYVIKIYTYLRKKPYKIRIRDIKSNSVKTVIVSIHTGGIFLGDCNKNGINLVNGIIKAISWRRILMKKTNRAFYRIVNKGYYIDKKSFLWKVE